MEKLTIVKLGEQKKKEGISKNTGKPYSFMSVGFTTSEYGQERWYNLSFNGQCPIAEGTSYELEVTSREYNGKTYWDARFPSKETELNKAVMRHESEIEALKKRVFSLEKAVYPAEERQ